MFKIFLVTLLAIFPHFLTIMAADVSAEHLMEYVQVCASDGQCKRFSKLILGTDHLAQARWTHDNQKLKSEEEIFALLDEAVKLGINLFDTAPIYVGGIENTLGKWMKSRQEAVKEDSFYYNPKSNPDRKLYALSKGGFPFDLYYAQQLESGEFSEEFIRLLKGEKILLSNFRNPSSEVTKLQNVPPGTYASRLFGNIDQIKERVLEELLHSSKNLNNQIAI